MTHRQNYSVDESTVSQIVVHFLRPVKFVVSKECLIRIQKAIEVMNIDFFFMCGNFDLDHSKGRDRLSIHPKWVDLSSWLSL